MSIRFRSGEKERERRNGESRRRRRRRRRDNKRGERRDSSTSRLGEQRIYISHISQHPSSLRFPHPIWVHHQVQIVFSQSQAWYFGASFTASRTPSFHGHFKSFSFHFHHYQHRLISVFFFPLGFSYCNNQLLIFFWGVIYQFLVWLLFIFFDISLGLIPLKILLRYW